MILIADASALIALAACDGLQLLDAIFGDVWVPDMVSHEVSTMDKPYAERLQPYLQGKIRNVSMQNYVYLDAYADAGETAAMLLYKEMQADYLLIDDKRGRKVAAINQINTIGSLGVLLLAKRAGLIPSIVPLLEQIGASPVFISKALIQTVLELAGESKHQSKKKPDILDIAKGSAAELRTQIYIGIDIGYVPRETGNHGSLKPRNYPPVGGLDSLAESCKLITVN
jgi:Predicted nucleic acid-binding protein, contains PIN domain